MQQFVSFIVDKHLYGLNIAVVKEANPNTAIAPVPRSPEPIRGLVNIRGQIVMVIDIAVVLGRKARPVTEDSHVIILKTARELQQTQNLRDGVDPGRFGERPVGFLVDRIGDVVTTDDSELAPAPPHIAQSNIRFIEGVIRLPGKEGPLVVLNAMEML